MDISTLKSFLLWCTIINAAMLTLSSVICIFGRDWVYSIHSRLFKVSMESLNIMVYSFIALYKMFFLMFNLVPYVALVIVG